MDIDRWSLVDGYIADKLIGGDPALESALAANCAAGLPAIDVSPAQGKMLHLLARLQGARRILEVGTLGGYSTIWLARALSPDGQLVSLELDPGHAEIARANLERAGVGDRVDVRVGQARILLKGMVDEGAEPFDLFFIDADKESSVDYLSYSLQLSRPGSLIIVDNVVREGRIVDPASDNPMVQGIRRLYDAIETTPGLSATAIQTVGAKGWDGFLMLLVGEE